MKPDNWHLPGFNPDASNDPAVVGRPTQAGQNELVITQSTMTLKNQNRFITITTFLFLSFARFRFQQFFFQDFKINSTKAANEKIGLRSTRVLVLIKQFHFYDSTA